MSYAMRRALMREATGPSAGEFAESGATFLVGMVRPAAPYRMAPQYNVTPYDEWYYPYTYVDSLDILTGEVIGALFAQPDVGEIERFFGGRRKARRMLRDEEPAEGESNLRSAAMVMNRWLARNVEDGALTGTWSVPSGRGYGLVFVLDNPTDLARVREAAQEIAKRKDAYYTVIDGEQDGEYLVAFVSDPKLVPLDFNAALAVADASVDPETMAEVDKEVPGEVSVLPVSVTEGVGSLDAAGAIFKKLKEAFGPKKPEAIKKRITKLEEELESLRAKLKEAEEKESKSSGLVNVGNVYGRFRAAEDVEYGSAQPGMFRSAAEAYDYGEIDEPAMFEQAEGLVTIGSVYGGAAPSALRRFTRALPSRYEDDDPALLGRAALAIPYGGIDAPYSTYAAETTDYGSIGELPSSREDLIALIEDELAEEVAEGNVTERSFRRMVRALDRLSDEELMELYQDLTLDDEAGAFAPVSPAAASSAPSASSASSRGGRGRRGRRRARRGRRRARRQDRRQSRRKQRRSRRRDSQQPQVVVLQAPGGAPASFDGGDDGGGDGYDDGGYDDGGDDGYDDDDGSDGVGAFAYGGPGYGDAALRMGRVMDLPRSPRGFVTTYPVG